MQAESSESSESRISEAPASKKEITISETAVVYAKQRLAQRGTPDAAIRLGIKGGGCSGFSYVIQFDDEPGADVRIVLVERSDVLRILVVLDHLVAVCHWFSLS